MQKALELWRWANFWKLGGITLFCCHRPLRLEIFNLDIISSFFPEFLYRIFGKDFIINTPSHFTELVISTRSWRRRGRQVFLLEVPWAGSHASNFGKSFLTVKRALGTCGRVPWNRSYHMLFQILPLCFAVTSNCCSFRDWGCNVLGGSVLSSPWMSCHRSQIAQLMLMVVYHPAASQIACKVGRQASSWTCIGSALHCIKTLRAYTSVVGSSIWTPESLGVWKAVKYWHVVLPRGNKNRTTEHVCYLKALPECPWNKVEPGPFLRFSLTFFHCLFIDLILFLLVISSDHGHQLLKEVHERKTQVRIYYTHTFFFFLWIRRRLPLLDFSGKIEPYSLALRGCILEPLLLDQV